MQTLNYRHCAPCNSPRPDYTCHKCGSNTDKPAPGWEYPELPDIDRIRALAKEVGYAIAVHGTLERDLDLVAIPWTEVAVGNKELIDHLCQGLVYNGQPARAIGLERKPLGRYAVNIQLNGWFKLIDLSITPMVEGN